MAPKPASTAGKAPVGSKAPAKTTSTSEGKKKPAAAVEGEKKKRKKARKERTPHTSTRVRSLLIFSTFANLRFQSSNRFIPILVSPIRPWQSSIVLSTIYSNGLPLKRLVSFSF